MGDTEYAWIQISDLHLFDNTELNTLKAAYNRLPHKEDVKFLVITGDLHQYKTDYSKTKKFLEELLDIFDLKKSDIFIVPGNHDSGECDSKEAFTNYIETTVDKDQDCYRNYFVKGKLIDCFQKYNEFIKDFYGPLASSMYPEPEQVSVHTWNNSLNIIHLNTAINCSGDNTLKQIVDIYQLSNLQEMLNTKCPSIIIAHHPFDNIHVSHQDTLRRYISDWKVSAYLCGDLHKELYSQIITYSGSGTNIPCIVCAKGTPENSDTYSDLGCIIYKKGQDNNVEVLPFIWDNKRKTFDPYNKFNSDKGPLTFPLLNLENTKVNYQKHDKRNSNTLVKEGESIWLPDAEHAIGMQARFETFANTPIINQFMEPNSEVWGLSAVKGVGKTYVLQIKSRRITKENKILLPIGLDRSAKNNWGTDTIHLETSIDLSPLKKYQNVLALWQYCIITYVLNQLSNIESNVKDRNSLPISNPAQRLNARLSELLDNEEISKDTYILCTYDEYRDLSHVMTGILARKNWVNFIHVDLPQLTLFLRRIEEILHLLGKESIVVMIDKVDQSIRQANAEEPVNCEDCKKSDKINICTNPNKSEEYCSSEIATCKNSCCYGCEIFGSNYSNHGLRIHGKKNKKLEHVNIWQYLQVGLLEAISLIKSEFNGLIEIYFTIRQEAFACENNLLGEKVKKIIKLTKELWYSKDQQRAIFYECIKHQHENLLYDSKILDHNGSIEMAFVGVDQLCHPYAQHLTESVFDSIYRHSFDRARDIQEYGQMLTEHMDEIRNCDTVLERGEKVKELIEEKAARMAFVDGIEDASNNPSYYTEKMHLLPNFWADSDNFKRFIMMFNKNLLMGSEAKSMCKKFNGIPRCCSDCEKCSAEHHPFSMLYKLGLLGQIKPHNWKNDLEQTFFHSREVTYIIGDKLIRLNPDYIYMLHPALTKSIEHLNKKVKHFSGFIIGKGLYVSKDIVTSLQNDFKQMGKRAYDKKYFYNPKS